MLGCPEGCLDTIGYVDFSKNVIKMSFYGIRTDAKLVRNLVIARETLRLANFLIPRKPEPLQTLPDRLHELFL